MFAASLLADAVQPGDYLTGGISLAGLIVNGGVLGWFLFVRIPASDKQTKERDEQIKALVDNHNKRVDEKDKQMQLLIESRDRMAKDMSEAHDKAFAIAEKDRRTDFQSSLVTVVEHCQREADLLRAATEKNIAENTAAIMDLRRTIEEFRESYLNQRSSPPSRSERRTS